MLKRITIFIRSLYYNYFQAIVTAAFEFVREVNISRFPANKVDLVQLWDQGQVRQFRLVCFSSSLPHLFVVRVCCRPVAFPPPFSFLTIHNLSIDQIL